MSYTYYFYFCPIHTRRTEHGTLEDAIKAAKLASRTSGRDIQINKIITAKVGSVQHRNCVYWAPDDQP